MEPTFLTVEELLEIHADQVTRYGGSPGLRDEGLLRSAAAMPSSTFGGEFLHADLAEMAAAYLFHIVANHPFIDGNKRTGAAAAIVFLEMNDSELMATEGDYEALVLAVAKDEADKTRIAEFFRRYIKG
ncbi:MAG: type II toxin-antitoxin system death-on-curing family toxin [Deltaproteobacteria bacterium]|nr:type II toxin-antitoxin system death-on-curing family toxin [Deltaproteobacteria bacterium]